MMHRLHLEEAQQSSFAITPARASEESHDEKGSESLAQEFQSLLAQITGKLVAIPDQGTAIAVALSQVAPPERIQQTNASKTAQKDGFVVRDEGEDHSNDESSTDHTAADTVDSQIGHQREQRDTTGEIATEEHVAETDGELGSLRETQTITDAALNASPQMVSSAIVTADSDSTESLGEQFSLFSQQTSDEQQRDVNTLEVVESKIIEQASVSKQVVETAQYVATRRQAGDANDGEDSEGEEELFPAEVATVVDENEYDTTGTRTQAKITQDTRSTDSSSKMAASQSDVPTATKADLRQNVATVRSDLDEQGSIVGHTAGQHKVSGSIKRASPEEYSDSSALHSSQLVDPAVQTKEARSDGNIQMLLLRQAFEGLRMSRNDLGEAGKGRSQSPIIQSGNVGSLDGKNSGSEHSARSKALTRPQIARMLERVETTLKEAARGRDGKTISLRLEPVDLGKVKVDVTLREGALHARISPENQQVMQALRDHAHELQGALRKLGLDVDSVTVSVASDDFSREMTTGQEMMDGRSFQQERNNMPQQQGQVVDNTVGNELALRTGADAESVRSGATDAADHWVA